jgi:hypothetical protein
MLFQRPIVSALTTALSEYFDGIAQDSLGLSLWGGTLSLKGLKIRRDVLLKAGIPLAVTASKVDSVQISIPWNALHTQPVVAKFSNVSLRCALCPTSELKSDTDMNLEEKQKQLASIDAELAAAEEELLLSESGDAGSILTRLKLSILRNLTVELDSIVIAVEVPPLSAGDAPSVLTFNVDKITLTGADMNWDPVVGGSPSWEDLRKRIRISGVSLHLAIADEPRRALVKPMDVQANLHFYPSDLNRTEQMQAIVSITMDEVAAQLDYAQACSLAMLLLFFEQRVNIMRFHKRRPTVPVLGNGRMWFRYAVRCVIKLVQAKKKKQLVQNGRERLEHDYLEMHKRRCVGRVDKEISWHDALPRIQEYKGQFDQRYYDLLERVLPLLTLAELRRRATRELKDEYEREVPLETRLMLQERARQDALQRNYQGVWGRTKQLSGAVWSLWSKRKDDSQMSDDDETANSPATPQEATAQPPKSTPSGDAPSPTRRSTLRKDLPVRFDVRFGGITLNLKRSDVLPVGTLSLGAVHATAELLDGISMLAAGRMELKVSATSAMFMDEVNRTSRCPVFTTAPRVKLLRAHLTRGIKGEIGGSVELAPWTVMVRRACLVELIKMASMPSFLFGETLEAAVAKRITEQTVEESVALSLLGPDADLKNLPLVMDSPARLRIASEKAKARRKKRSAAKAPTAALQVDIIWRVGAPTLILPAETDSLRTPAVVLQLGQLNGRVTNGEAPNSHVVTAALSEFSMFTALTLRGEIAKRTEELIDAITVNAEVQLERQITDVSVSVSAVKCRANPTSLATVARVSGSLRAVADTLITLGDGVSFIGCCVSDPVLICSDSDLYASDEDINNSDDDEGMAWRACELLVKTEGVGARTVIQITELLEYSESSPTTSNVVSLSTQPSLDITESFHMQDQSSTLRTNNRSSAVGPSSKTAKPTMQYQRIVVNATAKTVVRLLPLQEDPLQIIISVPQSDDRQVVIPIKCPDRKARDALMRRITESIGSMTESRTRLIPDSFANTRGADVAGASDSINLAASQSEIMPELSITRVTLETALISLTLSGRGPDEQLDVEILPTKTSYGNAPFPYLNVEAAGLRVCTRSMTEPLLVLGSGDKGLTFSRENEGGDADSATIHIKLDVPPLDVVVDHATAPDLARFGLYVMDLVLDEHGRALDAHGAKLVTNVMFSEYVTVSPAATATPTPQPESESPAAGPAHHHDRFTPTRRVVLDAAAARFGFKLTAKPLRSAAARYTALALTVTGAKWDLNASDADGISAEASIVSIAVMEGAGERHIVATTMDVPLVTASVKSANLNRAVTIVGGMLDLNLDPDHLEFLTYLNPTHYTEPFTARAKAVQGLGTEGATGNAGALGGPMTAAQKVATEVAQRRGQLTSTTPAFGLAATIVARQTAKSIGSSDPDMSIVRQTVLNVTLRRFVATTIRDGRECFCCAVSSVDLTATQDEPLLGGATQYVVVVRRVDVAVDVPWYANEQLQDCTKIVVTSARATSIGTPSALASVEATLKGSVDVQASHLITLAVSYSQMRRAADTAKAAFDGLTWATHDASKPSSAPRSRLRGTSLARRAQRLHSRLPSTAGSDTTGGGSRNSRSRGPSGGATMLGVKHTSFRIDELPPRTPGTARNRSAASVTNSMPSMAPISFDITVDEFNVVVGPHTETVLLLALRKVRLSRLSNTAMPDTVVRLQTIVLASGAPVSIDAAALPLSDPTTILCLRTEAKSQRQVVSIRHEAGHLRCNVTFPMESALKLAVDDVARRVLRWLAMIATDPSVVAVTDPMLTSSGNLSRTNTVHSPEGLGEPSMSAMMDSGRQVSELPEANAMLRQVTSLETGDSADGAALAHKSVEVTVDGPFMPVRVAAGGVTIEVLLGDDVTLGTHRVAIPKACVRVSRDALIDNLSIALTRSELTTRLRIKSVEVRASPLAIRQLCAFADALENVQESDWRGGIGPADRRHVLEAVAINYKPPANTPLNQSSFTATTLGHGDSPPPLEALCGSEKSVECVARILGVPGEGALTLKLSLPHGTIAVAIDNNFYIRAISESTPGNSLLGGDTNRELNVTRQYADHDIPQVSPRQSNGHAAPHHQHLDSSALLASSNNRDPSLRSPTERTIVIGNHASGQTLRLKGHSAGALMDIIEASHSRHRMLCAAASTSVAMESTSVHVTRASVSPNPTVPSGATAPSRGRDDDGGRPSVPTLAIHDSTPPMSPRSAGQEIVVVVDNAHARVTGYSEADAVEAELVDVMVTVGGRNTSANWNRITIAVARSKRAVQLSKFSVTVTEKLASARHAALRRVTVDESSPGEMQIDIQSRDIRALRSTIADLTESAPMRVSMKTTAAANHAAGGRLSTDVRGRRDWALQRAAHDGRLDRVVCRDRQNRRDDGAGDEYGARHVRRHHGAVW